MGRERTGALEALLDRAAGAGRIAFITGEPVWEISLVNEFSRQLDSIRLLCYGSCVEQYGAQAHLPLNAFRESFTTYKSSFSDTACCPAFVQFNSSAFCDRHTSTMLHETMGATGNGCCARWVMPERLTFQSPMVLCSKIYWAD